MKLILRVMLALAAFTVFPNAFAADSGDFFLNAKFGVMSETTDWGDVGPSTQTHSSWGAGGGYLWKLNGGSSLGLELGYMHFGDISDGFDANGFTAETTSANATTAGVLFQQHFSDDDAWIFQARAGLMKGKLDETQTFGMGNGPSTISSSSSQSGVYVGAGIGRQITQSFSLTLAYTLYSSSGQRINLDPYWLGLEAEYRF
jgi:hypothetical protein